MPKRPSQRQRVRRGLELWGHRNRGDEFSEVGTCHQHRPRV